MNQEIHRNKLAKVQAFATIVKHKFFVKGIVAKTGQILDALAREAERTAKSLAFKNCIKNIKTYSK